MNAYSHIAIAMCVVLPAVDMKAAEGAGIHDAMETLATSLNKRDRINALCTLRDAGASATPAAGTLARIIAIDPIGDEAPYAATALGFIGRPSIPLIAELLENGVESTILCADYVVPRFPRELEEEMLVTFEPILERSRPWEKFPGILVLGGFRQLSPAAANRIARALLSDRFDVSHIGAAIYIAPRGNDPKLLRQMQACRSKSMEFFTAKIQEEWRRRDSPIHQNQRRQHVQPPLPLEEDLRCAKADARLAALAEDAIPEVLENLRVADVGYGQYLWMVTLRILSEHAAPPLGRSVEVLDIVQKKAWFGDRRRGGTLAGIAEELSVEFRRKAAQNAR